MNSALGITKLSSIAKVLPQGQKKEIDAHMVERKRMGAASGVNYLRLTGTTLIQSRQREKRMRLRRSKRNLAK